MDLLLIPLQIVGAGFAFAGMLVLAVLATALLFVGGFAGIMVFFGIPYLLFYALPYKLIHKKWPPDPNRMYARKR